MPAAAVSLSPENEVEISLAVKAGANVVQVYGFCFDAPDGKVRIVMELCSHGSLRAHLKSLPRDKVTAAACQRCCEPCHGDCDASWCGVSS